MKIKVDNEKHLVIFECKTKGEMEYILDTFIAGCEKHAEEARAACK